MTVYKLQGGRPHARLGLFVETIRLMLWPDRCGLILLKRKLAVA
jgi:hypothetical protein